MVFRKKMKKEDRSLESWAKVIMAKEEDKLEMKKGSYITIIKVLMNHSGTKFWVIKRCDQDKEAEGEITTCGLPARAKDLPVGTTFKTIFTIPK